MLLIRLFFPSSSSSSRSDIFFLSIVCRSSNGGCAAMRGAQRSPCTWERNRGPCTRVLLLAWQPHTAQPQHNSTLAMKNRFDRTWWVPIMRTAWYIKKKRWKTQNDRRRNNCSNFRLKSPNRIISQIVLRPWGLPRSRVLQTPSDAMCCSHVRNGNAEKCSRTFALFFISCRGAIRPRYVGILLLLQIIRV